MSFILISAPVYKRAWILPTWFEAIERQDIDLSDVGFQFLTGPEDLFTLHQLLAFHHRHPEVRCFDLIIDKEEEHAEHLDGHRHWPRDRYITMAKFRNTLLDKARCRKPDYYFSLDTDVILHDPTTISQLVDLVKGTDRAVSPLMFMTPEGDGFPNIMTWFGGIPGERAYRAADYPIGTLFKSDIIMAAVMMSPAVYTHTRYEYHPQGEDIGWSKTVAENGLELYSASYLYTPHIMNTQALTTYLESGDSRGWSPEGQGENRSLPV